MCHRNRPGKYVSSEVMFVDMVSLRSVEPTLQREVLKTGRIRRIGIH